MDYNELTKILCNRENTNLEFKLARNSFSESDIYDYCAALSNGSGGHLLLGINNDGVLEGSQAFLSTHNALPQKIYSAIGINVLVDEIYDPSHKRVLCFTIPKHPIGTPIPSPGKYKYPMRRGESISEMDAEYLRKILLEIEEDYSDRVVSELTIDDLDERALLICKEKWAKRSGVEEYRSFSNEKLLSSLNLKNTKGIKLAALLLFGKKEVIDEMLPAAEIVFEWRTAQSKIQYDFKKSWRAPFYIISDEIWETINARNSVTPFQEGLFRYEIPAFPQRAVREAVLNAVAHRDYTIISGSIMIKASPECFEIQSPGGFPPGINADNVLYVQKSRNRRISETLAYTGLVERS